MIKTKYIKFKNKMVWNDINIIILIYMYIPGIYIHRLSYKGDMRYTHKVKNGYIICVIY